MIQQTSSASIRTSSRQRENKKNGAWDDVVVFCALLPVMGVGAHQGPPPRSVLLALGHPPHSRLAAC